MRIIIFLGYVQKSFSKKFLLIIFLFCGLLQAAYAQYDLTSIINNDELTYQNLPTIDKFNMKFVKKITKSYFSGDIQNGKGVLRIRIKQYLYRKDLFPETYDIYIAGTFKNGKLNGEAWIARVSGFTGSHIKKRYLPALKRGNFAAANKDFRSIIHGQFKDNVMQWGTYQPYDERDVLLTYQNITKTDFIDKHNLNYSGVLDYSYHGKLEMIDNFLYVNAQPTDTIMRRFSQKNEAKEWVYLEQNLYPSQYTGMFRMESKLYTMAKKDEIIDSNSIFIYMVPGLQSIQCSVKDFSDSFELKYTVYDDQFFSFDTIIDRKLQVNEILFGSGVFTGETDNDGKPEGFGSYTFLTESYIGLFKGGKPHGVGMKKTKNSILIGEFSNGEFIRGSAMTVKVSTRSVNKILDPTQENRHLRIAEPRPELGWFITNISANSESGNGIYVIHQTEGDKKLKWEYTGELDENYVPHGVVSCNGQFGVYEHGKFVSLTDEQLMANKAEQQRIEAEKRAKWLKESPCGVPGEWIKLANIKSYSGRVFCTTGGNYASFAFVHENAQYWDAQVMKTNTKYALYTITYPNFPSVTPGYIEFYTNGEELHQKEEYVFMISDTPKGYYEHCTQCGGSGALSFYATASNGIGSQVFYMRYLEATSWKDDFQTGAYLTTAAPNNFDGTIGLTAVNNTYLPCEVCLGMGCIAISK